MVFFCDVQIILIGKKLTSLDPDLHNVEGRVGKGVKNNGKLKHSQQVIKRIGIPK